MTKGSKKVLLIAIYMTISMFAGTQAMAQYDYWAPFALGVRGTPDGGGVNLRYFFKDNLSGELQYNVSGGTTGGSGRSNTIGLLVQYHAALSQNLSLFMGVGAHNGKWQQFKDKSKTISVFGFDAILGMEYNFSSVPISITVDAKPCFNYVKGVTIFPNNTFGLGIRYYFDIPALHVESAPDARE